jgi:hypothetical protein
MDMRQERATNHAAYQRLKNTLTTSYAAGRFVAIADGQIVADADDFVQIRSHLATLGKDPARILIVQVGVDYPETAVIFSLGRLSGWLSPSSSGTPTKASHSAPGFAYD